jgi:hypothetical protein
MRKICLILMLMVFAQVAVLSAQSKGGTVRGTVQDERKTLLPSVQITLTNPETKATFRIQSNEAGEYRFEVPPGTYEVSAELLGFKLLKVPNIGVKENETTRIDPLTLTIDNKAQVPVQRDVVPIPLAPRLGPSSNRL